MSQFVTVSLTDAQARELKHAAEKHGLRLGDRGRDEAAKILHELDRLAGHVHEANTAPHPFTFSFQELKLARAALDVHALELVEDRDEKRRAKVAERAKAKVEGARAYLLDRYEELGDDAHDTPRERETWIALAEAALSIDADRIEHLGPIEAGGEGSYAGRRVWFRLDEIMPGAPTPSGYYRSALVQAIDEENEAAPLVQTGEGPYRAGSCWGCEPCGPSCERHGEHAPDPDDEPEGGA